MSSDWIVSVIVLLVMGLLAFLVLDWRNNSYSSRQSVSLIAIKKPSLKNMLSFVRDIYFFDGDIVY
jgi:type IV secretory pathway TrbL component